MVKKIGTIAFTVIAVLFLLSVFVFASDLPVDVTNGIGIVSVGGSVALPSHAECTPVAPPSTGAPAENSCVVVPDPVGAPQQLTPEALVGTPVVLPGSSQSVSVATIFKQLNAQFVLASNAPTVAPLVSELRQKDSAQQKKLSNNSALKTTAVLAPSVQQSISWINLPKSGNQRVDFPPVYCDGFKNSPEQLSLVFDGSPAMSNTITAFINGSKVSCTAGWGVVLNGVTLNNFDLMVLTSDWKDCSATLCGKPVVSVKKGSTGLNSSTPYSVEIKTVFIPSTCVSVINQASASADNSITASC